MGPAAVCRRSNIHQRSYRRQPPVGWRRAFHATVRRATSTNAIRYIANNVATTEETGLARDLDIYLAGEWTPGTGEEIREVRSPGSGEHIANVPVASTADIDRAVQTTDTARDEFRHWTAIERAALLHRVAEAVAIAGRGDLGLQAAVFTSSISKAFWCTDRIRAGAVAINDSTDFWETFQPFGGAADTASGWGRGTIDDFTDLQTMVIDIGNV